MYDCKEQGGAKFYSKSDFKKYIYKRSATILPIKTPPKKIVRKMCFTIFLSLIAGLRFVSSYTKFLWLILIMPINICYMLVKFKKYIKNVYFVAV